MRKEGSIYSNRSNSAVDQISGQNASPTSATSLIDRFQSRGAGGAGNLRRGSQIVAAEQFLSVPQDSRGKLSLSR